MGLFSKNDELFELMSKTRRENPAQPKTSRITRRAASGSFGARRITTIEPEFLEVDGDALIVVEDGWVLGDEGNKDAEPGKDKTFAVRGDTLVVGACLAAGIVVSAFLFGRTSTTDVAPVQVAISTDAAQTTDSSNPLAGGPLALGIGAPSPTTTPASAQPNRGTVVGASFTPGTGTTVTTRRASATTVPAATPARAPAKGKYLLVVSTTTPKKARELAKWLNEQARSPIFGRADLQAYATRKGVVRIRGFITAEREVLALVKDTNDPLARQGTFHSAYYKRA